VSFSNLVTDQAANFANILDARSLELTFEHLDELWDRFVQPDTWAILPNLLYWLVLIIIALAKAAALGAITYGMIARRCVAYSDRSSYHSSLCRTLSSCFGDG
jgi:hypothetical protein